MDADSPDVAPQGMPERRSKVERLLAPDGRAMARAVKALRVLKSRVCDVAAAQATSGCSGSRSFTASQRQRACFPSAKGGPGLVSPEVLDPHEHMARATCVGHPADYDEHAVTPATKAALDWVLAQGTKFTVSRERGKAVSVLRATRKQLQQLEN